MNRIKWCECKFSFDLKGFLCVSQIDINSLVSAGDYSILLTSGISMSTSSLDVESTGKLSVQGGGSASPNSALGNITARSGSTLRLFNLVATAGSFSTNSNMVLQLSCTTLQLSAKMGVENVVDISGDSNSLLHFSGASGESDRPCCVL